MRSRSVSRAALGTLCGQRCWGHQVGAVPTGSVLGVGGRISSPPPHLLTVEEGRGCRGEVSCFSPLKHCVLPCWVNQSRLPGADLLGGCCGRVQVSGCVQGGVLRGELGAGFVRGRDAVQRGPPFLEVPRGHRALGLHGLQPALLLTHRFWTRLMIPGHRAACLSPS